MPGTHVTTLPSAPAPDITNQSQHSSFGPEVSLRLLVNTVLAHEHDTEDETYLLSLL